MSATVDLNVLVYAADASSDRHERAVSLLDHIATTPTITYFFWPVLVGFVRLVTHPSIMQSPLPLETALANIGDLIDRPHIVVAGEGERFWRAFRRTADRVGARGNLVPDAYLVALMHEHGVASIWSNDRDFRKFDGITVRDPFADRYANGF